jgi:hypothetical protein
MSKPVNLFRDAIQLLLEKMSVTELVAKMRINRKWRSVAQMNSIWDSLLTSKQLRDLLYPAYDDSEPFFQLQTEFQSYQDSLIRYLWEDLLAKKRRPQLLLENRPNNSSFVMFMFIWNALPHLYTDEQGNATGISTTSNLLNPKLRVAVQSFLNATDENEQGISAEQVKPVFHNYLASLSTEDVLADTLHFLPAIWIDFNNQNLTLTVQKIYGEANALIQQFNNERTGTTYMLRDNHIDVVDWNTDDEYQNALTFDYRYYEGRLAFSNIDLNSGDSNLKRVKYADTKNVPPLMMYFLTFDGKAEGAVSIMLQTINRTDTEVLYAKVRDGSAFFNHAAILGRQGRIRACIGCSIAVKTKCSFCEREFCSNCFRDSDIHSCSR